MTEFDADLKRAFASLEDPADGGFAAAVSNRVVRSERAASFRRYANAGAFLVAGGAFAFGVVSLWLGVGPVLMAQLGLDLAQAHGALAEGSVTASSMSASFGAGLTPLLLAAAAGVGGLSLARSMNS